MIHPQVGGPYYYPQPKPRRPGAVSAVTTLACTQAAVVLVLSAVATLFILLLTGSASGGVGNDFPILLAILGPNLLASPALLFAAVRFHVRTGRGALVAALWVQLGLSLAWFVGFMFFLAGEGFALGPLFSFLATSCAFSAMPVVALFMMRKRSARGWARRAQAG